MCQYFQILFGTSCRCAAHPPKSVILPSFWGYFNNFKLKLIISHNSTDIEKASVILVYSHFISHILRRGFTTIEG